MTADDHAKAHPEPEEGCRECAHTSRPWPPGTTIEDLLRRARLVRGGRVPMDIVDVDKSVAEHDTDDFMRRLRARIAEDSKTEPAHFHLIEERAGELESLRAVEEPTPAQLRRIAELMEIVQGEGAAFPWWVRAAAAGDQDAADYLMILIEENEGQGDGPVEE